MANRSFILGASNFHRQEECLLKRAWPRSRTLLCIGVAAVVLAAGCSHQDSDRDVMAKVNGYKITRAEVDKAYQRQTAGAPQKPLLEQERAMRLQLLQQVINVQLYLQKAERLGVLATDEEVESRVSQDKAPYTKEEFTKKLQDMGYTEDEYRQEIRRRMTIDKLLNKEIGSKITISDSDIQNFYNQNKAQFNVIEPQYLLAHIYVSALPNVPSGQIPGKAENEAQAYEKIKMIHNRLDSGEDFAVLASKYSEDVETGRNGGELQPLPESALKDRDAPTRDAILKLKPNQYSDVIKIVNPATNKIVAYRIVKLIGKEPAGQRGLNDPNVQQFIRTQLRNQREQLLRTAYDEMVRDGAEVHNYYAEQILRDAGQK